MERLTEWKDNRNMLAKTKFSGDFGSANILCKLAEYEDLEEQGLLLRLPCKVGDVVYAVTRDFISEYTIRSIEVYNDCLYFCWKCEKGIYINIRGFTNYQIGKEVFLTQTEAEQKLKEMESDRYDTY